MLGKNVDNIVFNELKQGLRGSPGVHPTVVLQSFYRELNTIFYGQLTRSVNINLEEKRYVRKKRRIPLSAPNRRLLSFECDVRLSRVFSEHLALQLRITFDRAPPAETLKEIEREFVMELYRRCTRVRW